MKTLNELKYILKNFFLSHALINGVYYCDDFDFNAERSITYPVANIEYLSSQINLNMINHQFKVVLGDLTAPDDTDMEDNVHSDMLQVAEDLYTYLDNTEGFMFTQSSAINKFTDDTSDRASGIVFTITLSCVRKQDWCSTPTK